VMKAKEEAAKKREKAKKEAAEKKAKQAAADEAAKEEAREAFLRKQEEEDRLAREAEAEADALRKAAEAREAEELRKAKEAQDAEASEAAEAARQAEEAAAAAAAAELDAEAGEPEPVNYDAMEVRYFKVLYDYDPAESSPNDPDDDDQELTLRDGDILKVYGDMEEDGFYVGEHTSGAAKGQKGAIPSNFIEEMEGYDPVPVADGLVSLGAFRVLYDYDPDSQSPNDEPELELKMVEDEVGEKLEDVDDTGYFKGRINGVVGLIPSNFVEMEGAEEAQDDEAQDAVEELPVGTIVTGLYDYVPNEFSPNDEPSEELGFAAGDRMVVMDELDDDGFYFCEHKMTGQQGFVPSNYIAPYEDEAIGKARTGGFTSYEAKLGEQ